jgi:hypothetical protein
MQMDFRLLHSENAAPRGIGCHQYWKNLTHPNANIAMGYNCVGSTIDENELLELVDIRRSYDLLELRSFALWVQYPPGRRLWIILSTLVVTSWLPLSCQTDFDFLNASVEGFFQLIDPYKLPQDQLIGSLQSIRSLQPRVDGIANKLISPHDVPGIATASKPVRIVVLRKGEMSRRVRPQGAQIAQA